MKFENLGDWCKWLEKNFSPEQAIPKLPVIIRLDGNNFHNWTKGLKKPFDDSLTDLMIETTAYLIKETNAVIGYTQSDEITLILYNEDRNSSVYHEGKKQKILSKLTSKCANFFNKERSKYLPNHNKLADFDCRIYQTPTLEDACNQILWRENDAIKNSVSVLSRSYFSHNSLHKLNSDELKEKLLKEKNVNWNELPNKLKRGSLLKRIGMYKKFTTAEIDDLPINHEARKNKNLLVKRNEIMLLNLNTPLNDLTTKERIDILI